MILIISIMVTLYMTKQIKLHTHLVRQCVLMLENIEIYINYANHNIKEIFKVLSENDNFDALNFIDEIFKMLTDNSDYKSICNTVLGDKYIMSCFDEDDIELLKGFFLSLGQSDINGQILNCKTYKEFFKQKQALLELQEKAKCKTQTAITIGLGLVFSIVII